MRGITDTLHGVRLWSCGQGVTRENREELLGRRGTGTLGSPSRWRSVWAHRQNARQFFMMP